MNQRIPSVEKIYKASKWKPIRSLDDILKDEGEWLEQIAEKESCVNEHDQ